MPAPNVGAPVPSSMDSIAKETPRIKWHFGDKKRFMARTDKNLYLRELEIQKRLEDAFKTPTEGSASPTSKFIIGKKLDILKTQKK